MSSIRAVVVDPNAPDRVTLKDVPQPTAAPNEALVRVSTSSLNLGEVRRISTAPAGWQPGWDIAGVVEQPAANGSGPQAGAQVVGFLGSQGGGWAEVVAVPTRNLAELPAAVSFTQAATLPVAGLTALRALEKGGLLLDRRVLITGASGGVGLFAVQMAVRAGAHVVGVVRRAERVAVVREAGARDVYLEENLTGAMTTGPYHLILDSVGNGVLANALSMLAASGVAVLYGTSANPEVTFDARTFYNIGGATLYGFILFWEVEHRPAAADLSRLAQMVATGHLTPRIDEEIPWTQVGKAVRDLRERRITGKVVLVIGERAPS